MSEPPTDKGREKAAQKAWRHFTKHFWKCRICRNRGLESVGEEQQFCPIGRKLFMTSSLTDDERERLEVWTALVRALSRNHFWKDAAAAAKSAGEFVARIGAIIGVVCGFGWATDEVVRHIHIRVDHYWWLYRVWHSWWWLIVPLGFIAVGRLWPPGSEIVRALAGGLWAVGVCWLALLGASASIGLWVLLLMFLAGLYGWFIGGVLALSTLVLVGVFMAVVGELIDRVRNRWPLIDRLICEICWTPDSTPKYEMSQDAL